MNLRADLVTPLNDLGNRMWCFNASVSIRRRLGEERFSAYRRILVWGIVSRVVVFATVLASWQTRWLEPAGWARQHHDPLSILNAWDGRWYRIVAQRGYVDIPHHQSDTAFFPLYPVLINALHGLGFSFSTAALVLANVGFVVALGALYELARTWLPAAFAERTAIYAALFPLGFVFSMSYPEGLVLAAMAGGGVCAYRGRWRLAAVLAVAATLARPEGLFIALPIAAVAFRRRHEIDARERSSALVAVAAAPAALASVMGYEQLTVGNALAFTQAQKEWGRRFSPTGVVRAVQELLHAHGPNQWLWRDAVFCIVYVVLLLAALRIGVPKSWIVMGALIVLLPLESGSFTSAGRFGLLALPIYAGLARFGQRRFVDI
jgi:hypothetical protein